MAARGWLTITSTTTAVITTDSEISFWSHHPQSILSSASPRGYGSPFDNIDTQEDKSPAMRGTMERKLMAILSADVKGYSRLMGDDEEATIRTLTAYREVMSHSHSAAPRPSGGLPGDNLLAEFTSVHAVQRCSSHPTGARAKNADLRPSATWSFAWASTSAM